MNRSSYFHPLIFTSALLTLAAQPGVAAMTTITGVQLNPTDRGLELAIRFLRRLAGNCSFALRHSLSARLGLIGCPSRPRKMRIRR